MPLRLKKQRLSALVESISNRVKDLKFQKQGPDLIEIYDYRVTVSTTDADGTISPAVFIRQPNAAVAHHRRSSTDFGSSSDLLP